MVAGIDEPYDLNFCFPVPQRIESSRVALTPFHPALHGRLFHHQANALYPEIWNCFPFGPFTEAGFFDFVEHKVRSDPGYILFCVWDKTKKALVPGSGAQSSSELASDYASAPQSDNSDVDGALAGVIALMNTSPQSLSTEIGLVLILPPFHRTHVASNAVGLLLHYTLELPNAPSPMEAISRSDVFQIVDGRPLGLRRVTWGADERNTASTGLAKRMGFRPEVVQRWGRVLPIGRPIQAQLRGNDPAPGQGGLSAAMLGLCWDDWEDGAKDQAQKNMRRTH